MAMTAVVEAVAAVAVTTVFNAIVHKDYRVSITTISQIFNFPNQLAYNHRTKFLIMKLILLLVTYKKIVSRTRNLKI